jgi:cyanophycinase
MTNDSNRLLYLAIFLLFGVVSQSASAQKDEQGKLILVGGGGTPEAVIQSVLDMVGDGLLVVAPQASSTEDSGQDLVDFFRGCGVKKIAILDVVKLDVGTKQIEDAALIWFGGGSQNRLMEQLPPEFVQKIRSRFVDGLHLGGTSAGVAVMSKWMITGQADLESIRGKGTELADGLRVTNMIVDQHFHRRRRFNRLMSAVLDQSESIGLGIDERTAVIVSERQLEVVGKSSVLIIDATQATVGEVELGENQSATDVKIHLLREGDVWELPGD